MHSSKKIFFLYLLANMMAMLTLMATAAIAEQKQTVNVLQPQALNHTGIYNLRQLDPNLTGDGIKFALDGPVECPVAFVV